MTERYGQQALEHALQTKRLGRPLHFYAETDSTNARIAALAAAGAAEGALAVAELQTAGRGRRGRAWQAPAGTGIWMSLLLRPAIPPTQAPLLTLLAGLAVTAAIRGETGLSPQIKWPNDILLDGKKLVGILTEMDGDMDAVRAVTLGIGINVNTEAFPPELADTATSLLLAGGRAYDRAALLARVLAEFEARYDVFLTAGFAPFLAEYRADCMTIGAEVWVIGREYWAGTALDITPEGELLVRRADTGAEEVVFSGEVSIRGKE